MSDLLHGETSYYLAHLLVGVFLSLGLWSLGQVPKEFSPLTHLNPARYPKALRKFVIWMWATTAVFTYMAAFLFKEASPQQALTIFTLFAIMLVPLHLEIFLTHVGWNELKIEIHSPWRRKQTIPFNIVSHLELAKTSSKVLLHTKENAIFRLPMPLIGVHELLEKIPQAESRNSTSP